MVVKVFTPYTWPSIVRKTVLALASLIIVAFVITHLSGNMLLFSPEPNALNILAKNLHGLGPLYSLAEIVRCGQHPIGVLYFSAALPLLFWASSSGRSGPSMFLGFSVC